ncbi:hypothetical protein TUBRATIS_008330 [Tubulinosema ratisbonensis]|uniref:Uncharacterized protein n=1 Tax=Tubulinosema ratisbonensis TaxID=291195 RepID=A0A437ANA8_9MICR|nr:hypothetical protein TUBRATIS_008330 [Tubulinosema ratisbonensis]
MKLVLDKTYLSPPKQIYHYKNRTEDFIAVLTEHTLTLYKSKSFNILCVLPLKNYSNLIHANNTFFLWKNNSFIFLKNLAVKEEFYFDKNFCLHKTPVNDLEIKIEKMVAYQEYLLVLVNNTVLFLKDYEVVHSITMQKRILNLKVKGEEIFILFSNSFMIYNFLTKEEQTFENLDNFSDFFITNIKNTIFLHSDKLTLFNYKTKFTFSFDLSNVNSVYSNSFLYISSQNITFIYDLDTLQMIGQFNGTLLNNTTLLEKELEIIKHKFYDNNLIIEDILFIYENNELIYKNKSISHRRIVNTKVNQINYLFDKFYLINDNELLSVHLSCMDTINKFSKTKEIFKSKSKFMIKKGKIPILHNINSVYRINKGNEIRLVDTNGNFEYINFSYEYPYYVYGKKELVVKDIFNNVYIFKLTNQEEITDCFIYEKLIYLLINNHILIYDLKKEFKKIIKLNEQFRKIKIKENIILLSNDTKVRLIEKNTNVLIREYELFSNKIELTDCLNYLVIQNDKLIIINLKNNKKIELSEKVNDFILQNNYLFLGSDEGIKRYSIIHEQEISEPSKIGFFNDVLENKIGNEFVDLWEEKEELLVELLGLIK